jgi:DNA-binding NtrC family response regulator
MKFYNLGGGPFILSNEETGFSAGVSGSLFEPKADSQSCLKAYLKSYTFDLNKIGSAKRILVVEEDNRIQNVLQRLIQEENAQAVCVFGETVDDVLQLHKEHHFDLVVANCYEADDEVDYEFWDRLREENPSLDVVILSHVNDREYYEMLEKLEAFESRPTPLTAKLKNFFEHVFGGRNGNH